MTKNIIYVISTILQHYVNHRESDIFFFHIYFSSNTAFPLSFSLTLPPFLPSSLPLNTGIDFHFVHRTMWVYAQKNNWVQLNV